MFDALTKGFKAARNRLSGVTELNEENLQPALRDVRLSLLEADVELGVTKRFLERVKTQSLGQVVQTRAGEKSRAMRVGAADHFIRICQEELEQMMVGEGEAITFAAGKRPTGILMAGLQGAGKTTTTAKLAALLMREYQKKPLLVAADLQRPGAVEQLQILGEKVGVPVLAMPQSTPVEVCAAAEAEAARLHCDVIVYDTAGRLAIDQALMDELVAIRAAVRPENVFLVIDAMIGQDAVKTAAAFHEQLSLTGVVLTKLDGDARGGAALSVKEVTGAPIRFAGMGEGVDKLEAFRPEGMASRILGFGDVVGLMKDFEAVADTEKAEADAMRMLRGQFTLDDFISQISMLQNMGPLQGVMEKMPFFSDMMPSGAQLDDRELVYAKAMVQSMTAAERRDTLHFDRQSGRLRRVAKGSGRSVDDVRGLIDRFRMMQKMMGSLGSPGGLLSKIPGMGQLAAANQLRKRMKGGGAGALDDMFGGAGMPPGFPGFGGMGGLDSMGEGGATAHASGKSIDRDKKKQQRKQQRKARRKSRK